MCVPAWPALLASAAFILFIFYLMIFIYFNGESRTGDTLGNGLGWSGVAVPVVVGDVNFGCSWMVVVVMVVGVEG